ncbi:solute carrier family 28 member 3-like isoform X1 [Watersipora subatra]|uniref:solute carrier family 28 member 3-like isoform X1 n=1 Tax=Watersipora subatra TaxID=2589382 RepID=UPI00355B59FE
MSSSASYELANVKVDLKDMENVKMQESADSGMVNSRNGETCIEMNSQAVVIDVPNDTADVDDETTDSESLEFEETACSAAVGHVTGDMSDWYKMNSTVVKYGIGLGLLVLWTAYFIWTMIYNFRRGFDPTNEPAIRLISINVIAVFCVTYWAIKKFYGRQIWKLFLKPCTQAISAFVDKYWHILKWVFTAVLVLSLAAILIFDVALKAPSNMISLLGLAVYIILCYVFSAHPSKVRWRPVILGLVLQFIFAYLILRTCVGYLTFKWLGDRVQEFLEHTDAGSKFVFGDSYENHFFAFKVLPVVVFFSTTISMLYYLGVMQVIILKVAWLMQVTMGTTAGESLNASANIFVGQTEAPLIIKPLLNDMTKSELHAVMTGGFATIAGSVLATYILFGVSPSHLLSASVMSAPAALAMSKLFYPETQKSKTTVDDIKDMAKPQERNIIEAASNGASTSIKLVANIAANLIAFLALLQFINQTLKWFGAAAGLKRPHHPELTFELICSYLLYPFAYVMGTPTEDCFQMATLIGVKTFTNEFIAYDQLGTLQENRNFLRTWVNPSLNRTTHYDHIGNCFNVMDGDTIASDKCYPTISERGEVIATYALCGFANLGSIGIMLGGLGAMAPQRKKDIATTVFRAMLTGNVACFMTACIAGLLSVPGALNPETCGTI